MLNGRIKGLTEHFKHHRYVLKIHLPSDSSAKLVKPKVEKIITGPNAVSVSALHTIIAFATWKENEIDKKMKTLYLKLPDWTVIDLEKMK